MEISCHVSTTHIKQVILINLLNSHLISEITCVEEIHAGRLDIPYFLRLIFSPLGLSIVAYTEFIFEGKKVV